MKNLSLQKQLCSKPQTYFLDPYKSGVSWGLSQGKYVWCDRQSPLRLPVTEGRLPTF